jgi:HSP20 family protein
MFKFFWVGGNSPSEDHQDHSIHVEHTDEPALDQDVGQVALDILDLEDSITIFAPLAGIDIANIDISVTRNILTISWERIRPALYAESSRLLVSECFYGPFSRSVILPENLAFNKVAATMEDNLLAIAIPKLSFPSKSIKINKLES